VTILYTISQSLYVNLTNRCPCSCDFCIRTSGDSVGDADNLWLEREPTLEEIIAEFERYSLSDYEELVFCGYGEPLERIDVVCDVCRYIRSKSAIKLRLNTNGLSDLIQGEPTAHKLSGLLDSVSISLNAPDAQKYEAICHPVYGGEAFDSVLRFTKDCKKYIDDVTLSVVDVISEDEIAQCRKIAKQLGVKFRVRSLWT
jgi:radical SAM enzyme (TIGR04100 family)